MKKSRLNIRKRLLYVVLAVNTMAFTSLSVPAALQRTTVSYTDVDRINNRTRRMAVTKTDTATSSQELSSIVGRYRSFTFNSFLLNDIPVLEVYQETGKTRPLVIILHGSCQSKEDMASFLVAFANAGYHAIAIDAYDHGERHDINMDCDIWASALITVADLDKVIRYYKTISGEDASKFALVGFSLGAVEATIYAETGKYKPGAIVALSGLCDTSIWQISKSGVVTNGWLTDQNGHTSCITKSQSEEYTSKKQQSYASLSASKNLDKLSGIPILCCAGTSDSFVKADAIQNIVKALQSYTEAGTAAGTGLSLSMIKSP